MPECFSLDWAGNAHHSLKKADDRPTAIDTWPQSVPSLRQRNRPHALRTLKLEIARLSFLHMVRMRRASLRNAFRGLSLRQEIFCPFFPSAQSCEKEGSFSALERELLSRPMGHRPWSPPLRASAHLRLRSLSSFPPLR